MKPRWNATELGVSRRNSHAMPPPLRRFYKSMSVSGVVRPWAFGNSALLRAFRNSFQQERVKLENWELPAFRAAGVCCVLLPKVNFKKHHR